MLDKLIDENKKELSEKEREEFNTEQRNAKINSTIKKQDLIQTEKIKKEEGTIIPKIIIPNLHGSLIDIAKDYMRAQKDAENKCKNKQKQDKK